MPLTETQRRNVEWVLKWAPDEIVGRPLWEVSPHLRPLFLSARRRRNILQNDPEPIGDPEYA